jgi:ribosomal protein S27AE
MFVGTINKGVSVEGFLAKNLLEPESLYVRHDALAAEMNRRGYAHKSPLFHVETLDRISNYKVKIDRPAALTELHRRCPECLALFLAKIIPK